MRLRTRGWAGRAIAAATVVGVIAAPLALTTGTAQAETAKVPPLKVMTRNLYLGVDIMRPLVAVDALPDDAPVTDVLVALANATHEAREIVALSRAVSFAAVRTTKAPCGKESLPARNDRG